MTNEAHLPDLPDANASFRKPYGEPGKTITTLHVHVHVATFYICGERIYRMSLTSLLMQIQLESECKWRQVSIPPYLRRWHDLRASSRLIIGR